MRRARNIRDEKELSCVSKSAIISMESHEEIVSYFAVKYGIEVVGFNNKNLFDVKATLAGYDDILTEFPISNKRIKTISYNSHINDCGNLNTNGLSEVGVKGLRDYGTGIHEAAHAYDLEMSVFNTHSYADMIVEQARKNLGLRINSRKYMELRIKMTGSLTDIDKNYELFAYAIETAKAGPDNELANEIYRLAVENK